ncbi:serine--tRNA ligase [Candidatus Pacearchaeota archaeon ex4484_71]|nr:MAG: serine--tRNA ligase [Candidatus Pacearchaeota archaeon ex4484_71]
MIDINLIRESPDLVKENIKKKFQEEKIVLVDEVLKLDQSWRKLKFEEDNLRSERNKISKKISELKKSGKSATKELKKAKEIPSKIASSEEKRKKIEAKIRYLMMQIPNIIHESVPIGKNEEDNVEIRRIGKRKEFRYPIRHHAEVAELVGGADFDSARDVSGSGFYYLEGDLALLHSAILSFARDYMVKNGFKYIVPPFMIRESVVNGVMSFEEKDVMMYKAEGEDLYLIGTSEHSIIGKYFDSKISGKDLPLLLTSYSPCFRKESGAHGIEEKGLYRVHQFEKQEMVVICEPEDSFKWYDVMLNLSVEFFKELGIPVRILECCSGDLADLKAKSADVEAWSPRQKKYFEVGSCSNLTDAQARRLGIRIDNKGKLYYAHTLNNTVVASPRVLIAILENFQNKDGSVNIPLPLQKYMGGKKKMTLKKSS